MSTRLPSAAPALAQKPVLEAPLLAALAAPAAQTTLAAQVALPALAVAQPLQVVALFLTIWA